MPSDTLHCMLATEVVFLTPDEIIGKALKGERVFIALPMSDVPREREHIHEAALRQTVKRYV